ncbi:hypothetical protein COJ48_18440 [Bacillus cereus]|nr:hypothetical protein COJ48_18440 [Bacillus cereus]PGP88733.1 hypothetical protein CN997_02405 [Bacillus cereus]
MNKKLSKKIMLICMTMTLMMSCTLFTFPGEKAEASMANHKLYKTEEEIVYADPNDPNAAFSLLNSIIAFIPQLTAIKSLDLALKIASFGISYQGFVDYGKNPNRFKVVKRIYKADTTTMNYWGYFYVDLYNLDTGKFVSSRMYPIAKMQ